MDFVGTSAARLHFPSNLNNDKKLVSEIALAGTSFLKINRLPKWFQPARNFQCLSLVLVTMN